MVIGSDHPKKLEPPQASHCALGQAPHPGPLSNITTFRHVAAAPALARGKADATHRADTGLTTTRHDRIPAAGAGIRP